MLKLSHRCLECFYRNLSLSQHGMRLLDIEPCFRLWKADGSLDPVKNETYQGLECFKISVSLLQFVLRYGLLSICMSGYFCL